MLNPYESKGKPLIMRMISLAKKHEITVAQRYLSMYWRRVGVGDVNKVPASSWQHWEHYNVM